VSSYDPADIKLTDYRPKRARLTTPVSGGMLGLTPIGGEHTMPPFRYG